MEPTKQLSIDEVLDLAVKTGRAVESLNERLTALEKHVGSLTKGLMAQNQQLNLLAKLAGVTSEAGRKADLN